MLTKSYHACYRLYTDVYKRQGIGRGDAPCGPSEHWRGGQQGHGAAKGHPGPCLLYTSIALIEDYLDGRLELFGQKWPSLPLAQREHIGLSLIHS